MEPRVAKRFLPLALCFFATSVANADDLPGWTPESLGAAFNPRNEVGAPARASVPMPAGLPVAPQLMAPLGPGSSNFQLNIPIASLPGRGLPLSLSFKYNSRVWTLAS